MLRTLLVLAVLVLTGLGLARLTAPAARPPGIAAPPPELPLESFQAVPFELVLSAPARSVTLEAGASPVLLQDPAPPLAGTLEIAREHPLILLKVEWADDSPGHRFAKLRLDPPGRERLEHVFSAPAAIDDIWEP